MKVHSPRLDRLDVALVSCQELPEPDPDAAPLARGLAAAGVHAAVRAWDDPDVDWGAARLTLLRSPWNYPWQRVRFLAWAERVARVTALENPLSVVRWNTHKGYLLELEREGFPVAPTALVPRGAPTSLRALLAEHGWHDVVIKPAVSAGSYRTLRIERGDDARGEQHLRALSADGDVLVQRYLPSVDDYGERALVAIDGALTHAVRKSPRFAGGDERVSTEAVPIAADERALAEAVLRRFAAGLLYGRVDVAPGPDGTPVLMELELVEPSLFFDRSPDALARFVAGVKKRLAALAS